MSIEGIKFSLKSIQNVTQNGLAESNKIEKAGEKKPDFGQFLKDAVSEVSNLQNHADTQIEGMVMGKPGISTHDAMIALEKADVAFQMMNTIRGKIIRAYEEVMRTQI